MSEAFDGIISEITGIEPKAYLILGPGFVREEWKSLCFVQKKSITQSAIQSLNQFAQSFVAESASRLLDRSARIELLRQSFKDQNLRDALPTLSAHRFRPKFFDSLDRALQKGRVFFAHLEEAKVLEERLSERLGVEARREEFFLLNRFWEKLLDARNFYDEARILEVAEQKLSDGDLKLPITKLYRVEHFGATPRVQFFWQSLARAFEIIPVSSLSLRGSVAPYPISRKVAHSLEDSVHYLFDEILGHGDLDSHAVVIEDRPEIRRCVKRVSEERGLKLQDPRDPTFLATSEEIKTVLLPLEIVARNFPSSLVLPWLATQFEKAGDYRKKIIEQGSMSSLQSYRMLPQVLEALTKLQAQYPSRSSFDERQSALFTTIAEARLDPWVRQTFERIFAKWKLSLEQLGRLDEKKPLRIFLDELKEKIKTTPPILGPERNDSGLRLYRVDQAVSLDLLAKDQTKVHFLGISHAFFEPRENATEWFSIRDIEVLSSEFGIPGRQNLADQSKNSFCSWASRSRGQATLWEYLYDEGGSESESLELSLQTIPELQMNEKEILPVHPRVLPSLGSKLKVAAPFESISLQQTEFPISFLNAFGNCAFTAYAQHLLKLYDERDPDFDLSGDSFGNLVHSAVEALVASELKISPREAFEGAWLKTSKPAWIRSDRLYHAIRFKTLSILEHFLESEKIYREQSRSELIGQEVPIELKRGGFLFHGRLDRIDQHSDGLVVFDYKTGSVLPSGTQTREKGKGLQLPGYALALKDEHAQEVVGAQYIQLLPKKTQRNSGFLFSKWNKGKKADEVEFPLSTATARSSSLIQADPEQVWKELDQKILSLIEQAKRGNFDPKPADPKDCDRCRYSAICGKIRASSEVVDADDT